LQIQLAGWTLVGLVILTFYVFILDDWSAALLTSVVRTSLGFILSLGLHRFYKNHLPANAPFRLILTRVVPACFGAAFLQLVISIPLISSLDSSSGPMLRPLYLTTSTFLWFFAFLGWSAFYLWLKEWRTSIRREIDQAHQKQANVEAELNVLRAQINFHFLFNTLNSIIATIDEQPTTAKALVRSLSDYLRFSLNQPSHVFALREEANAMRNYLMIEKLRFEGGFDFKFDISPEAANAEVPSPLLQPLIENAVKYGSETSLGPLFIEVTASLKNQTLDLTVSNTGHWLNPNLHPSHRIGLANLERRLAILAPGSTGPTITTSHSGVSVHLTIPLST
jgi:LytS/YehU family sensor histidine kinase